MKLSEFFGSGMVFAAGEPIRIFGSGRGSAFLSFGAASARIESDSDCWLVELPAMEYGGPYELIFNSGDDRVALADIYVGEVFLFSGQSNMAFLLSESNTPRELYENSDLLRYLAVSLVGEPLCWQKASDSDVSLWSAIGYLTARAIVKEKNRHVGIILAATGSSVIESWMPKGALSAIGINLSPEEKYRDHFGVRSSVWNQDGFLYENKLSRVIPFSLTGAVWYQGESDASEAEGRVYLSELCELIKTWRRDFRNEKLPFVIIQIADCESRIALGPGWRLIQAAQERAPGILDRVYTVASRDICETDAIHPPSKLKLCERIHGIIKNKL